MKNRAKTKQGERQSRGKRLASLLGLDKIGQCTTNAYAHFHRLIRPDSASEAETDNRNSQAAIAYLLFIIKTNSTCEYDKSYLSGDALQKRIEHRGSTSSRFEASDSGLHRDIHDYIPVEMSFVVKLRGDLNCADLKRALWGEGKRTWFKVSLSYKPLDRSDPERYLSVSGTLETNIVPYAIDDLFLNIAIDDGVAVPAIPPFLPPLSVLLAQNDRHNDLDRVLRDLDCELAHRLLQVRVYNVGQANAIYIRGYDPRTGQHNAPRVLFDIGLPRNDQISKSEAPIIRQMGNAMSLMTPDFVFLSHWHSDHIAGATKLLSHPRSSGITFIAPAPVPFKDGTYPHDTLIAAMLAQATLITIADDPGSLLFGNPRSNIQLWRSGVKRGGKPVAVSNLNAAGLVMRLRDTFLTGDSLYRFWPDSLLTEATRAHYIVVPHHGCKLLKRDETQWPFSNPQSHQPTKGEALVCCGSGNSYGHPNYQHMQKLRNSFYVSLTSSLSGPTKYLDFIP